MNNSPIENIRNIVRGLNEEMVGGAPTNSVSGGHIAGLPPDSPPVFKKKRNPTPVGRYGSRRMWLQDLKKNGK